MGCRVGKDALGISKKSLALSRKGKISYFHCCTVHLT